MNVLSWEPPSTKMHCDYIKCNMVNCEFNKMRWNVWISETTNCLIYCYSLERTLDKHNELIRHWHPFSMNGNSKHSVQLFFSFLVGQKERYRQEYVFLVFRSFCCETSLLVQLILILSKRAKSHNKVVCWTWCDLTTLSPQEIKHFFFMRFDFLSE